MPPAFDLVVFDCDGVLVDSEVLSCECLGGLLREHGYDIDLQGIYDTFLGRSFATVEERYRAALGYPLAENFAATHQARLREAFKAHLKPVAGVEAVLARLALPFCVASSSGRDRLAFSLATTRLAGHFGDRVFSADQVANGKPAPDLFLYAAGQCGAAPARTLVIEDSPIGVRAGKAAGMIVWGFSGGSHYAGRDVAALLEAAGADRVFRDMADFAL